MPKRAPDPTHVHVVVVRRGTPIQVPVRTGGYVIQRKPDGESVRVPVPTGGYTTQRASKHGLYFHYGGKPDEGFFVTADRLWEALDLVIDIEDEDPHHKPEPDEE